MPKRIESRDNPRFKQLRRLAQQVKARREAGVILLDGLHLVDACLAEGRAVEGLVLSGTGAARPEIAHWLDRHPGLEVLLVPDRLFVDLVETESPSGILALAARPPTAAIDGGADAIVLDGVQDPGNLGTLLRTAAGAGVPQAILGPGCADPWSAKALRAGQGAQFLIDVHEQVGLAGFLGDYRGVSVVTALDATNTLYELSFAPPVAWIFGAEGRGVSEPVVAAAAASVRIPMPGRTESLNVAAAAAVCLFEMARWRKCRNNAHI